MSRIAYVNGAYVPLSHAGVSVEDRGFQFSDSIYEVMSVYQGRPVEVKGHLTRLFRSLQELEITPPTSEAVLKLKMKELIRRNNFKEGLLYIQISRGVAKRDFVFPQNVKPSLVMTYRPYNISKALMEPMPIKAYSAPDLRWKRRDIKTTLLLPQAMAKENSKRKGGGEVLMVDEQGFITEGGSSNLWMVTQDNVLVTRQPSFGILKGVTREAIHRLAVKNNLRVEQRKFTVEDAQQAKELFVTAASSFVKPIIALDDVQIGAGKRGEYSQKLAQYYLDYLRSGAEYAWDDQDIENVC